MAITILRKLAMVTSLSIPIFLGNFQSALATDVRDFSLHNDASVDIQEVYVSPSGQEAWGKDILETDILGQGEAADISFEDGSETCLYDLKAVAADGRELDQRQINFCEVATYTITD